MAEDRLPRIMVTCAGRAPSVELGAIIPLSELQKQKLCEFRYKDETSLSPADIAWCDILFVVRGTSSETVWAAQWAKKHERIVLGYWDDDLLGIPSYSLTYAYFSSRRVKANIGVLFKLTDAFFSPNPRLATKLTTLHSREARLLPGVHGAERFEPPESRDVSVPIVGYSGGPDHVQILNLLVGPVIAEVIGTGASFELDMVGPKPDFLGRLHVRAEYRGYVPSYRDYLALASKLRWDIGLAPQVDSEFTTYKFYNKLLEYTHIGCAGIYTKIEPYVGVIEDGVTGLLVPNEVRAWSDAILRLLRDPQLRFKIASNAYEFVQSHHNRRLVAAQYKEALVPYLGYRAPAISKAYAIAAGLAGRPKRLWQMGIEHTTLYGLAHVLYRAPRYAVSLLRRGLRA